MGAAAQWVRSVHLHLLVLLPNAGIRRGGRVRWRRETDRRRPRWMPTRETERWGMGARPCAVGTRSGRGRETCGTRRNPRWGAGCGQQWKMAWRACVAEAAPAPEHATAALAMPHQRRRQGTPDHPREAQAPGAPHNLARLRHDRERRGRSRRQYPTGRRWGADPGELGVGTPSPLWGREAGHGGPAGYRSPTVGKPVTVPASRSACGICGRPACGKKPRRQQRFIPRTRGSTPGHHSCSGACVRRSLSGCPPSVPAVEAPIQGSSLRPC